MILTYVVKIKKIILSNFALTTIECVKIWTNFKLNFLLYCVSARSWRPRKPDASSKQLYSENGRNVETKCGV